MDYPCRDCDLGYDSCAACTRDVESQMKKTTVLEQLQEELKKTPYQCDFNAAAHTVAQRLNEEGMTLDEVMYLMSKIQSDAQLLTALLKFAFWLENQAKMRIECSECGERHPKRTKMVGSNKPYYECTSCGGFTDVR